MLSRVIGAMAILLLSVSSNLYAAGFVSTGLMTEARAEHQAVLLKDGRVLIIGGGTPDNFGGDASAELYNPSTGIFTATGSMNFSRRDQTAVLLKSGKVLVYGGAVNCYSCQGETYDPATGTWTLTQGFATSRLDDTYETGTLLHDGTVLTSGGWALQDVGVSDVANLFNPATGQFTDIGRLSAERYSSTATLLPDGRVLIAGGDDWSDGGGGPLANVDIFNPRSRSLSVGPLMTTPRSSHTATLLKNGKVFIAGGTVDVSYDAALAQSSTEIFDPATNAFSIAGQMTETRAYQTATLLPGGRVLIAGGQSTVDPVNGPPINGIPDAEIYHPGSHTFTRIGNMLYGRQSHQAVLLRNGKVLLTGGYDANNNRLATAELYEPNPPPRPLPPSITPTTLNLGTVPYETTGQPMSIVIENPRRAGRPLFIEGETISEEGFPTPDFSIVQSCAKHLRPGQSCEVSVTFAPTIVESETATLTIYDDSPNKQETITLTGTGGRPIQNP